MFNKELVRAVGFDLDETIYPSIPEINDRIRNKLSEFILAKKPEYETIFKAREYFEERYKSLQSGRKILIESGYKPEAAADIADLCVSQAEINDLLKKDEKTSGILNEIGNRYFAYLLTSSPEKAANTKLRIIGINPLNFQLRVFRDTLGPGSKKSGEAFKYAVNVSKIENSYHVYIGNSAKSDIIPAKTIGMQTIGVWSEIPEADISIPHIYDLERILL